MKLLIWDFDGTLAHRPGLWSGALLDMLTRYIPEHEFTREHLRPFLSTGFRWHRAAEPHAQYAHPDQWWEELHPVFERAYIGVGLGASEAAQLARHVRTTYIDPAGWQVYDDTLTTLAETRRLGWHNVILSNHVPELSGLCRALGMAPLIERIFNSAELGFEKPHPDAFHAVLSAYPEAHTAWMIGDSLGAEVQGAAGVGLPAILVRAAGEAQYVSADLSGVLDILADR